MRALWFSCRIPSPSSSQMEQKHPPKQLLSHAIFGISISGGNVQLKKQKRRGIELDFGFRCYTIRFTHPLWRCLQMVTVLLKQRHTRQRQALLICLNGNIFSPCTLPKTSCLVLIEENPGTIQHCTVETQSLPSSSHSSLGES